MLVIIISTTQARKLPKREHLDKFHFITEDWLAI